ncbi:MAG: WxcM domain protein [Bacteriovoracaceae bacterium]|nr:WxcM domain protein [Bacteriovoracaceae bacterium]
MREGNPVGEWINAQSFNDPRGSLKVFEAGKEIPFDIRRIYYLSNVPSDQKRGGHAHRTLHQVFVAISGSFTVLLDDGKTEKIIKLGPQSQSLYVGPMLWRELYDFSPDGVCLCLASNLYEEADYIRDYSSFLKSMGSTKAVT